MNRGPHFLLISSIFMGGMTVVMAAFAAWVWSGSPGAERAYRRATPAARTTYRACILYPFQLGCFTVAIVLNLLIERQAVTNVAVVQRLQTISLILVGVTFVLIALMLAINHFARPWWILPPPLRPLNDSTKR